MSGKRYLRVTSRVVVAGAACAVYAWTVIGAFAHTTTADSAAARAYEYQSNGHVTGVGTIVGKSVTFSFVANADASGLKGNCNVKEGKTNVEDCVAFNSLVVVGTHATFSGTATHNGVTTTFTINVDDLASPGKGRDRFAISTGDGYSRSDVLSSGDIQVHSQ